MAADARCFRQGAAHAARGGELLLRLIALVDLSDLEQRNVGVSAVGIFLHCGHESWNQTRPHVGEIGRDGVGERKLRLAAAEQFGLWLGNERPRHRFDQAARAERAFGLARAQLDRSKDGLARKGAALERRWWHAVEAD